MAFLDELAIGLGRVVTSQLRGAKNAVLLSLKFLEDTDAGDDETGEASTEEPYYRGLGLYGRPRPAVRAEDATPNNPEGEAEVIAAKLDDRAYTLAFRDLRIDELVNPKDGEIGLAHYLGGFVSLKINADGDGTDVVIYAPHRDGSGTPDAAHAISLDSSVGNSHVSIIHSSGQSITLNKDGDVIIASSDGTAFVQVKDGDIIISGTSISLTGGVNLGDKDPTATDFVALAALVLTELQAIQTAFNGHTHNYLPGPGAATASTTPNAAMPSPSPVAATVTKAK